MSRKEYTYIFDAWKTKRYGKKPSPNLYVYYEWPDAELETRIYQSPLRHWKR